MKLSKPSYNENVVDVDALEKIRIHEEAETDRKAILEQELTKRQVNENKENTKRSDGYASIRITAAVTAGIVFTIAAVAGAINISQHFDVQKASIEAQAPKCPPPPKCPELVCQPVPVKETK